jgi:hypothetical protein
MAYSLRVPGEIAEEQRLERIGRLTWRYYVAPIAGNGQFIWEQVGCMHHRRAHGQLVMLPDGRAIVIGGSYMPFIFTNGDRPDIYFPCTIAKMVKLQS